VIDPRFGKTDLRAPPGQRFFRWLGRSSFRESPRLPWSSSRGLPQSRSAPATQRPRPPDGYPKSDLQVVMPGSILWNVPCGGPFEAGRTGDRIGRRAGPALRTIVVTAFRRRTWIARYRLFTVVLTTTCRWTAWFTGDRFRAIIIRAATDRLFGLAAVMAERIVQSNHPHATLVVDRRATERCQQRQGEQRNGKSATTGWHLHWLTPLSLWGRARLLRSPDFPSGLLRRS
jgi:hypothetical protein